MKLRKINGVTNKLKELKFQLNIRVKGFGFNSFPVSFSSGSKPKTVGKLPTLLKDVIRAMQGNIFEWPEIELPERKSLPIVGTLAPNIIACNTRQRARKEELTNQVIER